MLALTVPVMRSFAIWLVLGGCALYTGAPEPDEPAVTSHVTAFDIPQITSVPLDVLVVIDSSARMAPVREHVLAGLPVVGDAIAAIGGPIDLHVGVVTADPADGARVRGTVLTDVARPDGAHDRNYAGSLGATLATLADAGDAAAISAPLAMMQRALAPNVNPGFRRDGAVLLVVIVANDDDESLGSVDGYAAALPAHGTYVTLIAPSPAPRLDAFVGAFSPDQTTSTPIGGDYSGALALRYFLTDLVGVYCFDEMPTTDCAMDDVVDGDRGALVIAPCDASSSNRPCWQIREDLLDCTFGSHLTLDVNRAIYPPPNDHVVGQCVVAK